VLSTLELLRKLLVQFCNTPRRPNDLIKPLLNLKRRKFSAIRFNKVVRSKVTLCIPPFLENISQNIEAVRVVLVSLSENYIAQ
jgi:hypothetical protein